MGIFRWIWQRIKSENLWSGIFPTLILTLFAWVALWQTTEQLKILQEEIRFQRDPILIAYTYPSKLSSFIENGLYIGNIGNDTAENVNLRFELFLVNETTIYSYGQSRLGKGQIVDSTRGPRGLLFSRLRIKPDTAIDFSWRVDLLLDQPFLDLHEKDDQHKELFAVQNLFKGSYVLYIECSFKRKSDYVQRVDTIFFSFSPFTGPEEDLKSEIGGVRVINRLKKYLEEGPKLSINIFRDRYEVYKHTLEEFPPKVDIVQRLPRKTNSN